MSETVIESNLTSAEHVTQKGKEFQQIFNEKIKTGSLIKKLLSDTVIYPLCLTEDLKETLELHQQYNNSEMINCTLEYWQTIRLMGIEPPSDREIIWIIEQHDNNGKTWLQKYIEHHFGTRSIFRTSNAKDPGSLLHMFSKRTLACTDIFLLNISTSCDIGDAPYTVLEDIL